MDDGIDGRDFHIHIDATRVVVLHMESLAEAATISIPDSPI
jgi:hypothetical protein